MSQETDLAWAAGFFDGEGCIQMHRGYSKSSGKTRYFLDLIVSNTNLKVLQKFHYILGIGRIVPRRALKPTWRPSWLWKASCKQAEIALNLMLPYLVGKKEQAELGLLSRQYTLKRGAAFKLGNPDVRKFISIKDRISKLNRPAFVA